MFFIKFFKKNKRFNCKYFFWAGITSLIAYFFSTNYAMNHFYVNGGYMLDSGWFAYLSSNSLNWPINNPPSIGGSYFETHFSPIFYIYTAIYSVLNKIGVLESSVTWFSITQGFWLGLVSISIFSLLSNRKNLGNFNFFLIFILSILISFNGVFLASIGFLHFEIAIPSLLVSFFAFYIRGCKKIALFFLFLGLLSREDAGLHYFGILSILTLYLYLNNKMKFSRDFFFYFFVTIVCLLYSLVAFFLQKTYFNNGDNALQRVYLGNPIFHHVSFDFIKERIIFFSKERLYILLPIFLLTIISIYKKSFGLFLGVLSVIPWIIFSFFAISFQAGTLTSYYAFPVSIALFWPAISYALFHSGKEYLSFNISMKEIVIIAFSSILFYINSYGNHDGSPWGKFFPNWINTVSLKKNSLNDFIKENNVENFIFDDSIASLMNKETNKNQWKYNLDFSNNELQGKDAILFQKNSWLINKVKEIAKIKRYSYICQLPNTDLIVISNFSFLKKCKYSELISSLNEIDTRLEYFDYIKGWSNKEELGRWTIGSEIILPNMQLKFNEKICIKGHGFLPEEKSKILVNAYASEKLLGTFHYDKLNKNGERCILLNDRHLIRNINSDIKLKISGFSSPLNNNISDDDRLLGIFVEKIYLK